MSKREAMSEKKVIMRGRGKEFPKGQKIIDMIFECSLGVKFDQWVGVKGNQFRADQAEGCRPKIGQSVVCMFIDLVDNQSSVLFVFHYFLIRID